MAMETRSGLFSNAAFAGSALALLLGGCGSGDGLGAGGEMDNGTGGATGTGGLSGEGGMTTGTGGMMMGMGGGMMGSGGSMKGMGGRMGPDSGTTCHSPGTIGVTDRGMTAYVMDGQSNPTLTLCRGSTYTFTVNAPGHPFYINSVQGTGTRHAYASGVTGNGATNGDVVFVVPTDAPSTLYYNCSLHAAMTGVIRIVS